MEAAETYEGADAAVVVCDLVCAEGIRNVHLDHDEVGCILKCEWLNVFVDNHCVVFW